MDTHTYGDCDACVAYTDAVTAYINAYRAYCDAHDHAYRLDPVVTYAHPNVCTCNVNGHCDSCSGCNCYRDAEPDGNPACGDPDCDTCPDADAEPDAAPDSDADTDAYPYTVTGTYDDADSDANTITDANALANAYIRANADAYPGCDDDSCPVYGYPHAHNYTLPDASPDRTRPD